MERPRWMRGVLDKQTSLALHLLMQDEGCAASGALRAIPLSRVVHARLPSLPCTVQRSGLKFWRQCLAYCISPAWLSSKLWRLQCSDRCYAILFLTLTLPHIGFHDYLHSLPVQQRLLHYTSSHPPLSYALASACILRSLGWLAFAGSPASFL